MKIEVDKEVWEKLWVLYDTAKEINAKREPIEKRWWYHLSAAITSIPEVQRPITWSEATNLLSEYGFSLTIADEYYQGDPDALRLVTLLKGLKK